MKNWSTDLTKFKTPIQQRAWEISQQMNYGIHNQKLDPSEIKKLWAKIAPQLSSETKRLWEIWLWDKRSSLHNTNKFWQQ